MQQTQSMSPAATAGFTGQKSKEVRAYFTSFDVLRITAVVAVVWIHAVDSGPLAETAIWCRFAVPAFTALSVFLMALSIRQKPLTSVVGYVPRRAWSIYRLFLIWNAVYFLARLVKHHFLGGGHAIPLGISSLLIVGLAGHLWYLPFLALLGIALALPVRGLLELKLVPAILASVVLLLAGLFAGHLATLIQVDKAHQPLTYFGFLALSTFPAALLVVPIAWLWNCRAAANSSFVWPATTLFLAGGCLLASLHSGQSNTWHNLAGVFAFLAALYWPVARLPDRLRYLGELAFPVYVLHPLLIDGLRPIGLRLKVFPSIGFDLLVFLVTVCGSFLIAHLLSANRWFSWSLSTRPTRRNKGILSASSMCKAAGLSSPISSGDVLK
jgi:surface polysaccharide O-acyltransferase-like enzyme